MTRGLPWASALRSCGSVKTTWKYGIGSRSAFRAASQRSFGTRLTLGTVPIPTGVIGEAGGSAAVTRLPMPAKRGGAARRDRAQRPMLHRRQSMRAPIRLAMGADDVGEFAAGGVGDHRTCGPGAHALPRGRRRGAERREEIERRARGDRRVLGQLEVARGGPEVPVPEQALDGLEVDPRLEQVRREGVP